MFSFHTGCEMLMQQKLLLQLKTKYVDVELKLQNLIFDIRTLRKRNGRFMNN